jgi:hypothetical protein
METWKFFDFLDGRGVNLIRQWLDGSDVPEKASAKIDARILYMQTVRLWPEQYVSSLDGWPDLVELRVVSAGSQYRPIGFYGPGRREFTLVLGAIEKGKLPRRVLQAADDNRKIALSDRRRIREHEFAKGPVSPESENQR